MWKEGEVEFGFDLRKRYETFRDKYFDTWGKFWQFLTADQVF